MVYKYLLSILLNLVLICTYGQSDIDYGHKLINKEIVKLWGFEQPKIEEISIPDSFSQQNSIQGKYFSISNKNIDDPNKHMYIGRVNSCRAGGCSISWDPNENFETEYFDYFILFDPEGTIQAVRIFNYAATHGHEVSAKGWLRQFSGYEGKDTLEVGQNIDAISGATISVYAITEDIQEKTSILKKIPSRF